jgi:hypothetical protein
MATGWTAYCAPGRKAIAELALWLRGEHVAEITEHPWLEGSTDVWLVSPDALEFPDLPVTVMEPLPRCPMCRGISHLPWCSIAFPPLPPWPTSIILTGI